MASMPVLQPLAQDRQGSTELVLGVDTHKQRHVAAVVTVLGEVVDIQGFPADAAGYRELVAWCGRLGTVTRAGVEGTCSYGAALARHLAACGIQVLEVTWPDKAARRRSGKTDQVDALAAARAVLSGRAGAHPKAGDGPVQCARLFKLAKDSALKARTQAINQLRAVLVTADPQLREALEPLARAALIRAAAALPDDPTSDAVQGATVLTLRLLAQRIQALTGQINELKKRLAAVMAQAAPVLLARPGIGPDSAAALLIAAGDNPDRLRCEAAFAALCGVSPVEHSSGKQHHRRLNRGGDRQANAALYRIVQSRLRFDQRTRDYLARRTADGKTRRAIIRCLKRYVAREVFTLLQPA